MLLGVTAVLGVVPAELTAQAGGSAAQSQPAPQALLALQRTYDRARSLREPVAHLLADGFVEIQADGRMLTRSEAIEKYGRFFDEGSRGPLAEHRALSYGDVAIVAGYAGEEGTPYSARRLHVWVTEQGSWRLLVLQKTFMRSRAARLSPLPTEWPAGSDAEGFAEEQAFAGRDPARLLELLADDAIVVDGYGDRFSGQRWLEQLGRASHDVATLRGLVVLERGVAAVVIGSEMSTGSSLVGRFTRVWTRAPDGMQLRVSQTTLAAVEASGPER